ncbi:MAG: Rossman fold protein, TIGR00730 family [Candidatus Rokubacteria bacterium 13_2_20CM_2_64_8]|nr:MAG: Rossman fold protein, TIGR00730 family [Candidatus Rokubacteria bacterium 13_2_20CM_2_64_8]OLD29785.1 MAG: Rossman fold protein, TIGR00730 family [Candidatus Rokubacteria bacterium 13_1_40CM_2_68_13]
MKRICVFAGSSAGGRPAYAEAARELGQALVGRGLGVVYGGGSVGLMGTLADAVLAAGGEVIGVIPGPLARREFAHAGLTRMHVVGSMHERKALMASLVDGFVALPGGFGTFEETLEVLTWSQLGIHRKPIGLLNVDGYYDGLRRFIAHAVGEGFVRKEYAGLLIFADAPGALLEAVMAWRPPDIGRVWLDVTQT